MLPISKVCPSHRGDLKACLLKAVIASRWSLDGSIRNLIRGICIARCERKCSLQKHMFFLPVDIVVHDRMVIACIQNDLLNKLRTLPRALHTNDRTEGS